MATERENSGVFFPKPFSQLCIVRLHKQGVLTTYSDCEMGQGAGKVHSSRAKVFHFLI